MLHEFAQLDETPLFIGRISLKLHFFRTKFGNAADRRPKREKDENQMDEQDRKEAGLFCR